MNLTPQQREKLLMYAAVGAVAAALVIVLFFKMFINPTSENWKQVAVVQSNIEKVEDEIGRDPGYRTSMGKWITASFGPDDQKTSELSRAHLVGLLNRAKLNTNELTLTPLTGKRIKGGREIGWAVHARGPLERAVDFLYLLQTDPRLYRIENVTWTPVTRSAEVDLSLKIMTLVLDPVPNLAAIPGGDPEKQPKEEPDRLADKTRAQYALIAERDLFRPYMKKPPTPVTPGNTAAVPAEPADPLARFRLVGLPTWKGQDSVVVLDTTANTTQNLKVGEDLMNGEIVMVDYRALPRTDKPFLNSPSRVIVRIGPEFWGVELGQFLSNRRKLAVKQLPESLQAQAQAAAAQAKPTTPVKTTEPEPQSKPVPNPEKDSPEAPEPESP